MSKFHVTIYKESYTTIEVEADNQEQATEMVRDGEYNETHEIDTWVKDSEVIEAKQIS